MSVDINLKGRVALITGASRQIGIGAAIARLLAQAGADIFFTYYLPYDQQQPYDVQPEEPRSLLDELRALGIRADAAEGDLSDTETPVNLFEQVELALGPVDILVNNATHDFEADIYSLTDEVLDQHYAVNIRGATLLCQEFARRHDGRPGGRIINLVSGEMLHPMADNLPYAISKGAVEALTISLSAGLAAKHITVNAIDPGATDTGWMTPEIKNSLQQRAPFGRIGQPEDAAHLALFLASPFGEWITGQILHSRGGF